MADTIAVKCPKCQKGMTVPATLAGKKIRCKGCEAPVAIPAAKAKKEKEPEVFKLKEEEPEKKTGFERSQDNNDDDDTNPYGLTHDPEMNIPRCAFCAKELDPPDARICKNCGYDMRERRRHASKAVYENTIGDYLNHHIMTIVAFLVIIAAIGLDVFCFMNLDEWFDGSIFEQDEKDPTTDKKKYWVGPGLAKVWITLFVLFVCWYAGRFIYRKLTKDLHPIETLLKE